MRFETVRFNSSLLVVITFGSILQVFARFWNFLSFAALISILFLYHWYKTYGIWMSREKRAVFNEKNVMLTYQPRALTHGHLFEPDPPTPVPGKGGEIQTGGCTATSAFQKARDEHYKNEFVNAEKMSLEKNVSIKKIETLRIEYDDDSSTTKSPSSSSISRTPSMSSCESKENAVNKKKKSLSDSKITRI